VLLIGLAIALCADPLDNWTPVNSGTTNTVVRVEYGNGRWIAFAQKYLTGPPYIQTSALSSVDGTNWGPLDLGRAVNYLSDIRYGGGKWIAVGGKEISISSDGISWTNHAAPAGVDLDRLTYGEGKWAAIGVASGTNGPSSIISTIALSNDGLNWTNQFHTAEYLSSISYGGGL